MESERMPEEWRDSVLIPIFKNKGDVQRCSNYRGIKLISHTMKLWERIVEKRLKKWLEVQQPTVWFHAREKHYRCIVCFESVDGEVQRRSEGATLCVCGPGESLWQGAKRRGVVLHEKVWIGREVRENSTRYVWWQYNSGEVCGRSDGGVRGDGGTASRIGFEPLFVCNGDG